MWVRTDLGDLINLKYSRRIAVCEAKKERVFYHGDGETTYSGVPESGWCLISFGSGKIALAHRETRDECESVLESLRVALKGGDAEFDTNFC